MIRCIVISDIESHTNSSHPDGSGKQHHDFLLEKSACGIERIAANLQMGLGIQPWNFCHKRERTGKSKKK